MDIDAPGHDGALGALLGTFIGDALGMPFEGSHWEAIPERVQMVDARRGRGTYTDDTQMMIALAESLLACDAIESDHLASSFLSSYDPDRGYGGGTRRVLRMWSDGIPVAAAAGRVFGGAGSRGNGAAMRIAPVAVRFANEPTRLLAEAERSARVTHAHPVGVDGAVVQAAALAAALTGRDVLAAATAVAATDELTRALRHVRDLVAHAAADRHRLGSTSDAAESVPAALVCALTEPTFEQAVCAAVRLGGDTDTIAAMAGAIAGARDGVSSIPDNWLALLEDDDRGRSHVERLAHRLVAARRAG
jgi:poly(ADP-ribose) glycohydrolase ARH3